jgi:hypothetical protein
VTRQHLGFRGRRWLIAALACLAFLYLAYVIAILAALEGGALARLTRDSEDFKLEARAGYSFWPTRVVLRDARFRYKDYNIEVSVEARKMSLSWSPWALLDKTIQIDEVDATDARYKMLHRVEHARKNRQRLAAYPDIGFDRPKVYDSPSPPYGIPPFRIRVESIRGNVLEAWILEYRALGNFETTGGFEIHENVTVFPSHADLSGGQLFMGDKRMSRLLDCDVRAKVGPFLGSEPIAKALAATDAQIQCDAELEDLSAFHMYFPDSELLLEGNGKLSTDITAVAGMLRSSTAELTARLQRVGIERAVLAGRAQVTAQVAPNGAVHLTGDLRGDRPAQGLLDLEELRLELDARQPKALELLLQRAHVRGEGLGVRDPTFARRSSGTDDAPLGKLEQTSLDLGYTAVTPERPGSIQLQTRGTMALFPAVDTSVSCAFEALLRCSIEEEMTRCPGSALECKPLMLSTGPEEKSRIAAKLVADAVDLTKGRVSSEWLISLGNPKDVLQATVANDVWTELGLALAPLGGVEARVRVNRHADTLAGTVDYVRSGPFSAQASFLLAKSFVSRWRVDTPVGRFGVLQTQAGTTVTPFVGNDWGERVDGAVPAIVP